MPTALMILGALVLAFMGLVSWGVMLINKSLFTHSDAPLAFNIFGIMAVAMIGIGWILDRFDR